MKQPGPSILFLLLILSSSLAMGKGRGDGGELEPKGGYASRIPEGNSEANPFSAEASAGSDTVQAFQSFKTTRLVNAHTVETLIPRDLDFRVTHRFGDIAGNDGGIHTLFGIDRARDIRIGLEYGLMEDLMIGAGRSKGAGPIQEVYDGFAKYRVLDQTPSRPFSLALLSSMTATSMKKGADPSSPAHFEKGIHRLSYFHQALIASRISDRLSLQLMPSYSHRNLVSYRDRNRVYGVGLGGVIKLSKKLGIIGEYHYLLRRDRRIDGTEARDPYSLGIELETGGHVFHINLSNSGGIGGAQFLPHTRSNALDGEFRLGFTISRLFRT